MFFPPKFETNTSLGRFFPQFVFQSKDLLPLVTILTGKMTMILSQKPDLVKNISSTLKKNYSLDNNMLSIKNKISYTLSSKKDKISNTLVGKLPGKMTMILSQKQELVRAKEKPTKPIRWSFVALLENCFCFISYWWSSPTAMSALAPMHSISICVFFLTVWETQFTFSLIIHSEIK